MCVQVSRLTGPLGCVITGSQLLGAFWGPGRQGHKGNMGSSRAAAGQSFGPMITPRLAGK